MSKLKWMILVAVSIVVTGYFGYRSYIKQREHHIFCEGLSRGMTLEQVFASLETFGEIVRNRTDVDQSGYEQIAVAYARTNSQIFGQRAYLLSFQDGRYIGVGEIVGFERVDYFCEP